MDHGEDIKAAIAREMHEEVSMQGGFAYKIIDIDEPAVLPRNVWQLRLIFEVTPEHMEFKPGHDSSKIAFMDPALFKDSERPVERRIYRYSQQNRGLSPNTAGF